MGDPGLARRQFADRAGQFVPVGMVGDDQRNLDPALPRPPAHPHPARRHRRDRVGQPPAPLVGQRRWRADDDLAAHILLWRVHHQPQLAQRHAILLVELAHPHHRAVQIDRLVPAGAAQLGDHPLRLAQRIGADQQTMVRLGFQPGKYLVELAGDRRMPEHRQAKGRLGDEDIAGHRLERRAGRVRPPLEVAGDNHPLALIFHQDLGRAEHMARGMQAEPHPAPLEPVAIAERRPRLGAIAQSHDRQRLRRRPHLAMAATRVIGMAMGDHGMLLRCGWIDPDVGRAHINALRMRFNPVFRFCHCVLAYWVGKGSGQGEGAGE